DAYDYVIVAMPYSASVINESADVRMKIPALYDEDNNLAWNSSNGGTTANLPVEYIEKTANYNSTGYSDFLGSTGLNCSKTDSNISNFYCFINTSTNMIYMKVPHFSTIEPNIVGTASATSTTTTTTSGGGGLAEVSFWSSTIVMTNEQFTNGYTKEMPVKARFRFTVNSEQHTAGIISLTTTTATINISSTPQQATLSIGDTRKFDVNDDKFYDVIITLNSIASAKASLTIKSIHEAVTTTTQAQETLKEAAATGGQETGTEITESTPKKDYTLIGILITLLIIVVAVVLLIRKIRNDKWISLKTQKKKKVYIKL
ncbi:MAG: hypothetical protein Q7S33_04195, partial [Nanoarchaeota archaeon]|nr:hypothetical protein [Nanoarchaeota archaeon]